MRDEQQIEMIYLAACSFVLFLSCHFHKQFMSPNVIYRVMNRCVLNQRINFEYNDLHTGEGKLLHADLMVPVYMPF